MEEQVKAREKLWQTFRRKTLTKFKAELTGEKLKLRKNLKKELSRKSWIKFMDRMSKSQH